MYSARDDAIRLILPSWVNAGSDVLKTSSRAHIFFSLTMNGTARFTLYIESSFSSGVLFAPSELSRYSASAAWSYRRTITASGWGLMPAWCTTLELTSDRWSRHSGSLLVAYGKFGTQRRVQWSVLMVNLISSRYGRRNNSGHMIARYLFWVVS